MKTKYPFFTSILFFLFLAIDARPGDILDNYYQNPVDTATNIKENSIPWFIREEIKEFKSSSQIKIDGRKIFGNQYISDLYERVNFQPVWTDSKNTSDLLRILEDSFYEGLNPDDYHLDFMKNHLVASDKKEPKEMATADILMTDAILTYAFHMVQGKVNPSSFDPNWNYHERPMPDDVDFRLLNRLQTKTLNETIDFLRPEMPLYHELQERFVLLDSMKKAGGEIHPLEYPGSALKPGVKSPAVIALKDHMNNYGYMFEHPEEDLYDEELEEAVKDFQMITGLETDGICGKGTYKALNVPLAERLDIIRVNMERCRWINNTLPEEFILVNIADYNLYIFRNNEIEYRCRVVVGKEFNKTPVFTSDIKYVVFNPTWTVPYSISSKEILPKLKKDANYLQNRNMTLLMGDQVINPSTIDFKQYSQNNFPYTIRQEPGPNNALGLVKFIFPNKYAVYLHDTPSKSFFERTDRAFSHGCVRVKDPLILAEELLDDQGYDSEKIAEVIQSKKLKNVYLTEPMPVMIMYWTCYVDDQDGEIRFFRDVYGRDKKVLQELKKKR